MTGHNLPLLQNFLHLIPVESTRHKNQLLSQQPAEFHVDELFNVEGVGLVLGGILKRGVVREGESLMIGPNVCGGFTHTVVQSIRYRINRAPCHQLMAGQAATITVAGIDRAAVRKVRVVSAEPVGESDCLLPRARCCCQRLHWTRQLTAAPSLRWTFSCWSRPTRA